MKKVLLVLMTVFITLLLTACDIPPEVFRDDEEVVTEAVEGLLASVRSGDMDAAQRAFGWADGAAADAGSASAGGRACPPTRVRHHGKPQQP